MFIQGCPIRKQISLIFSNFFLHTLITRESIIRDTLIANEIIIRDTNESLITFDILKFVLLSFNYVIQHPS